MPEGAKTQPSVSYNSEIAFSTASDVGVPFLPYGYFFSFKRIENSAFET